MVKLKGIFHYLQHYGFATNQEIAQAVGLPTAGSYMRSTLGDLINSSQICFRPQKMGALRGILLFSAGSFETNGGVQIAMLQVIMVVAIIIASICCISIHRQVLIQIMINQ